MSRQKKEGPDVIRREDITLLLNNNFMMARNFLEQRVKEVLTSKELPHFKAKSSATLQEYTKCYTEELNGHIKDSLILPEEVVLSLLAAARLIHLTHIDTRGKMELLRNTENIFE